MIDVEAGTTVLPKRTTAPKDRLRLNTTPWWQWINIFSLDAVSVAVVWQILFAQVYRARIGAAVPLVLACSVWVIYTVDHLLDTAEMPASHEPVRKFFLRRYRRVACGVSVTSALLTFLIAYLFLSRSLFQAGMACGLLVFFYLIAIHLVPAKIRSLWPRQAVVAVLFSTGVAMPVWLQARPNPFGFAAATFLFLLLCWFNCCAVEVWEWRATAWSGPGRPDPYARSVANHLRLYASMIMALTCCLGWWGVLSPQLGVCILLSAATFIAVASCRNTDTSASKTALWCTLLDLALLSPLFMIV